MNDLNQFNLNGSQAIVTGGSKGIGLDISLTLAKAGSDLIISGRNEEDLEIAKQKINNLGRECHIISADLSKEEDIETFAGNKFLHAP